MNGNFADDIVAIQKPYGLAMFGEDLQHSVEKYLPALAESLGCQTLHQVHRLDKITSGILLLAKVHFSNHNPNFKQIHPKSLFSANSIEPGLSIVYHKPLL